MEKKLVNINDRFIKVQSRNRFLMIACIALATLLVVVLFVMGVMETLKGKSLFSIIALILFFVWGGLHFQKRMEIVQGKANQGDRV